MVGTEGGGVDPLPSEGSCAPVVQAGPPAALPPQHRPPRSTPQPCLSWESLPLPAAHRCAHGRCCFSPVTSARPPGQPHPKAVKAHAKNSAVPAARARDRRPATPPAECDSSERRGQAHVQTRVNLVSQVQTHGKHRSQGPGQLERWERISDLLERGGIHDCSSHNASTSADF